MTNALISTIVAAAATFLAAGLVIQFAVGSSRAAQEELRGGVEIDNPRAFYQLIMYDSLIAYQCDSSAGGNLDATGNNDWAPWKAYKDAADAYGSGSTALPAGMDPLTFQHLNSSFRGDELKCYGTETSIGGVGVWNSINPSSREWRNDQEGEHSRIRWSVPDDRSSPIELKECIYFDQSMGMGGSVPAYKHNPDKGWNSITDMLYYMVDNEEVNSHDMMANNNDLKNTPDCQKVGVKLKGGSNDGNYIGQFLTVTWMCDDTSSSHCVGATYKNHHSDSSVDYPRHHSAYGNGIRGPDSWQERSGQITRYGYRLCPGARGYIQTNTGWTWDGGYEYDGKSEKDYMKTPNYVPGTKPPGEGDREKYSDLNDDQDNSVHPFIVIEDVGSC